MHRPCPASREIFVPIDTSIRIAVILYDYTKPHNHPMPAPVKASYDLRDLYVQSLRALGTLGATVRLVDNGMFIILSYVIKAF